MRHVASAMGRSATVMNFLIRRTNRVDVSFICVHPIEGRLFRIVRRLSRLGINASIREAFRQASSNYGTEVHVHTDETNSACNGY